ncbi:MFS transporter, FHS family, L-fucose permease [Sphingomonas sp. YR710]|jgi:FHS family L-fucose permease-like MFS transporter|uniref:sugar MFS transporter n=1 Tax=Sphingomonas sp. YR710 TaxID=1882773 RepID=UPI0008851EDF|nr:sugar MFS transporter [Sphingomonas sp. YR710]SDD45748.1 MFS transporter, FHS family, L-fucose permease [Sphingomonas sp. YR710]
MLIDTSSSSSTDPTATIDDEAQGPGDRDLRLFVFGLFFAFGGITSLNDVIIPKLKGLFTLSYGEAMLVQSAFFAAYFIVSLPASAIVRRFGYLRTAAIGLLTMTLGCLLFIPASGSGRFPIFLIALFVLAAGITIVQVVANPLISRLGPANTASSRLTFAQAFNSLGTTIFPYVGAILILGGLAKVDPTTLDNAALALYRTAETRVIVHAYIGLAVALLLVAGALWLRRNRLQEQAQAETSPLQAFMLLKRPRFAFGALCIFLYVGAEVTIGSLMVAFLTQTDVMAISAQAAGKHVAFYWGGAMVGRFIGAGLLRLISPGKLLAAVATGSITLILIAANSAGPASGWALLAIGLCNAIMFPTIFSLASLGLGTRAAEGSGIICMAIVGGAILPPLTGHLADLSGLRLALAIPAACYLVIMIFGLFASRPTSR